FFFFQAEDGIRDFHVTGVQTCALPIYVQWMIRIKGAKAHDRPCRRKTCLFYKNFKFRLCLSQNNSLPENYKWFFGLINQFCCLRSEERRVGKECRSRWSTRDTQRRWIW